MNKDAAILVIYSNTSHGELLIKELSDVGASVDMVATPQQGIEAVPHGASQDGFRRPSSQQSQPGRGVLAQAGIGSASHGRGQ